ncbi:XkdW family protein [Paenibacillus graminis]|uniref:XkdW family protein n=1 Tax=Paenibacillus graminis TaxID=189425 RepID=UPI002DBF8542|nr:XkdW family protein [Paenibacillus graminis]MEC0170457.1 XkdW family protein [Paenibacillus graminis]
MNIALAIMHLYPQAAQIRDFMVQDNGPEPVLRQGAEEKGRVRYEIKPPEEGEKPVEGIHYRYGIDYNLLTVGEDYDIVERGPYIAVWNLDKPKPTETELQAAWKAYQEAEANKPPELTEVETLQLALADTYEQLLAAQGDATSAQVALADLYELTLRLQADVVSLKGGVN